MFEQLTDRLTGTFDKLRGKPRVTLADIEEALREVRVGLLEADVHYGVVKDLVARVREKAAGIPLLPGVQGAHQVVKIVHEELVATLGGEQVGLAFAERPPTVILVVGLQGSGKTTTAAKLANVLRKQGRRPLLVAADTRRPAAIDQLVTLGRQLDIAVRTPGGAAAPEKEATRPGGALPPGRPSVEKEATRPGGALPPGRPSVEKEAAQPGTSGGPARASEASPSGFASPSPGGSSVDLVASAARDADARGHDVLVADTAGRLHIDDAMMRELEQMVARASPREVLLVVDAMTGQDAVRAASDFKARLPLTGLILTKVDGDARGGAALSIRAATGVPVKFLGTGEKLDALEAFHPDRLAGRILGMGDVLTLVERAQEQVDRQKAEEQAKKLLEARFTFDDFLAQLRQVRKMGPLTQLLGMVPGMAQMAKQLPEADTERELRKIEAMICSMTREERADPSVIGGSRRRRIARGSATTVQEVNRLLKQFEEMQRLMKQLGTFAKGGRLPRITGLPH